MPRRRLRREGGYSGALTTYTMAIDALYKAPGIDESERWAMLSMLYEVKDQVDGELGRFRGEAPPA